MKHFLFISICLFATTLFSQEWKKDFKEAETFADEQNKNIVLVFSGSDWCAPCIKLDKNVWQSDAFKNYANEHWVLYKADFPRKKANKLTEQLETQNGKLAEKYNQNGFFPLVVVLDRKGKVLGETGFENVSAEEFLKILIAFEG
jgi:thioredoxin-related protein